MSSSDDQKSRIKFSEYEVENVSHNKYGANHPWNFECFTKNFDISIEKYDGVEMEFDLIGVHASLANAFRRLLLSDVPSMAAEKVLIYNNTSLIKDEVLSHRLGLIPLKADPRMFEYRQPEDQEGTEQDTLEFELKVKCSWNPVGGKHSSLPQDIYTNSNVYSKDLKWLPIGSQASLFSAQDVGPLHDDILLVKMRPGQAVDLKIHAVKGVGRDHAKFSPVATAYYRLLPTISLKREFKGELAERLQSCFSPGVIGLDEGEDGQKVARLVDARYDSCSRNVNRHDELKAGVELGAVVDHFIFTVESVGALPPDVLFLDAVAVLQTRCRNFLVELNQQVA